MERILPMTMMDVLRCDSQQGFERCEGQSFSTPWAARAFGMVLAAARKQLFTLNEFQQALIVEITEYERASGRIDNDDVYYSRWIGALTTLLIDRHLIDLRGLERAEAAVHARLAAIEHLHDHGVHAHDALLYGPHLGPHRDRETQDDGQPCSEAVQMRKGRALPKPIYRERLR